MQQKLTDFELTLTVCLFFIKMLDAPGIILDISPNLLTGHPTPVVSLHWESHMVVCVIRIWGLCHLGWMDSATSS
jgi:hypothetical protein